MVYSVTGVRLLGFIPVTIHLKKQLFYICNPKLHFVNAGGYGCFLWGGADSGAKGYLRAKTSEAVFYIRGIMKWTEEH